MHPQGFRYLKEFRLDPFPIFTYEIEGIEIEKTVFMVHGENSTIIQYQLGNVGGSKSLPEKIALELRPVPRQNSKRRVHGLVLKAGSPPARADSWKRLSAGCACQPLLNERALVPQKG